MPFDGPKPRPSRSRAKREEQEAAAYELTEAQAARRAADTRWETALKRATAAAVIPDYVVNPEPVGTTRQTYVDDTVSVVLFVAAPIEGMNHVGLVADLVKAGVEQRLINRLTKKHRTESRPAHRITTTFVNPRAPRRRGSAR